MQKVVITGARGVIGSVLMAGLVQEYDVRGLDLPDGDIGDRQFLTAQLSGVDAVIHLAGNFKTENWRSQSIDPANVALDMNVFESALAAKVPRLIMASSVHADDFIRQPGPFMVPGSGVPTSPYGAHKILNEALGRYYASWHSLSFIGVRFGGVTPDDRPRATGKEPLVWLSHKDCATALKACLQAKQAPGDFTLFYAVSNNTGRMHDTTNPFGWQPVDNSADYLLT